MLVGRRRPTLTIALSTLAAAVALVATVRIVHAEDPTLADEILNAFTPKTTTRSLTESRPDTAQTVEQANFLDSLRRKTAGSLSSDDRQKLAALAKDKPSIDVKINFDFNSD